MKKLLIILCLLAPAALRAQISNLVTLPLAPPSGTYPFVWSNAVFWTNATWPAEIEAWQAAWAANHNMVALSNAVASGGSVYATNVIGLADAQTNSVLCSPVVCAFTTNSFSATYGTTNMLPWMITNIASLSWDKSGGLPAVLWSTNNGAAWMQGTINPTLGPVRLALTDQDHLVSIGNPGAIPIDSVMSNVVVRVMARPDLLGHTNQVFAQSLLVDTPASDSQAANKAYVDNAVKATPWWSAQDDVQMNQHALRLSTSWKFYGTSTNDFRLAWLGQDTMVFTQPPPAETTNAISIALDGTGTNVVVSVATNGLTSALRLKCTRFLAPMNWEFLSAVPVSTGGNWVFTFPMPYPDSGFLVAIVPSSSNGLATISADLAVIGAISGNSITISNPPWQPALTYQPATNGGPITASQVSGTMTNSTTGNASTATSASGGWPFFPIAGTSSLSISTTFQYAATFAYQGRQTTDAAAACPTFLSSRTLSNLVVRVATAPGSGTNFTFTVLTNGVASEFLAVVTGGNTLGNSGTTSVTLPANGTTSMKVVGNNPTGPGSVCCGWTMEMR